MGHVAIDRVLERAERAKSDSDFTYFFSLLLAAEALAKSAVLGMTSAIADDKDRNRYRLEHQLARADGLGEWGRAIEDVLSGTASQFLLADARAEQVELTKACKEDEWQHDATSALKSVLQHLQIEAEELPVKTDMKRWFRLFATLRNKTRAHGATQPGQVAFAAQALERSVKIFNENFSLFQRPWAHLYRNLSGKYRISAIAGDPAPFSYLKQAQDQQLSNGIYVYFGGPRRVALIQTDPELRDFYFANGGLGSKTYELLSYYSDDRVDGDASVFLTPPGLLPSSETEGRGELVARGRCFTNTPDNIRDYVSRPALEDELLKLLLDDKRPIITLVGRGGIGKTSLALSVLDRVFEEERFAAVVWLSARDVDLQLTGPKPVRPIVLSPEDMGKLYSSLVLSAQQVSSKGFNPRVYLEHQLQSCDLGPCLFVFDNFETTQNPIEIYNWIDAYIRLPSKVLITTRLREFKGDYPVEVSGMHEPEARRLIEQTAEMLDIAKLLTDDYVGELLARSEGHPYVIKVLLGEVAKARRLVNIPRLVAGTEDILTALFERTYASLSPCAQRAFLTLSAWNSPVPRLALETVLIRSTEERNEVERGVESLLQYSMAEVQVAPADNQEFIGLPLVAHVFGKKKLNISPAKPSILADVEILQLLGPSRRDDVNLGLARRLETFLANVSRRIETGAAYDSYAQVIEAICRSYNPGWMILARWHMEDDTPQGYERAKDELRRFLESAPTEPEAAEAWRMLAYACYQTGDLLGEVHALVERAQLSEVAFKDLSNIANRFNVAFRDLSAELEREHRQELARRVLKALDGRRSEAEADDLSRMAWLALHCGQDSAAREYVEAGLRLDGDSVHLERLAQRLGI